MILGIDCSRFALEQPTGVEIYTDRLLDGILPRLDELGYTGVRLYAKTPVQVEKLLGIVEEHGQETVQVKLIEHQRLWTLFWLSLEMLRNRPDVLFVPSHVLPFFVPGTSFWTVHGVEAISFPKAYTWIQRLLQNLALRRAKANESRIIAVSHAVKKDLVDLAGFDADDIEVVHNGFDSEGGEEKDKTKKELESLVSGDYILNVGRLERRKNQQRLIEAFEKISGEFPDLKLALAGGDGIGAARIKERVESSTVKDRIDLLGYQDRGIVHSLMKKAKVFAYPSLAEGFGIPILEAFEAGCPVLTSKGSACEEIGGEAAAYCDPSDVDTIAEGLRGLLRDERVRGKLIEAGKKRVKDFSWKKCVRETMKVLAVNVETVGVVEKPENVEAAS